jgi:hypothetical protein
MQAPLSVRRGFNEAPPMQRLVALDLFRQERQAAAPTAESWMIRNSDLDTEQIRD